MLAGWSSLYVYMADLLCLDACRPVQGHQCKELSVIATPLCQQEWERSLARHPDSAFARYICSGLKDGFRVGYSRNYPLKSTNHNMESATQHPEVVEEYLHKECALNRMLGPFPCTDHLPRLHISRFGVIPKGHNTGKFRLITDLSSPAGQSVNDGIDSELCSCRQYSGGGNTFVDPMLSSRSCCVGRTGTDICPVGAITWSAV